jgi:hypothetical protein
MYTEEITQQQKLDQLTFLTIQLNLALIAVNSAARRNEEFFPEKVPAFGRA